DRPGLASGSGVSILYNEPPEQTALPANIQQQLNGMRGVADVSAIALGVLTYYAGQNSVDGRYSVSGGTSASAPMWGGLIALADQAAGKPLGSVNAMLYRLGASGRCFHDVTDGSNKINADPGDPALTGWDFPTGWGTPDAGCLIPALAAMARGG